MADTEEVMLGGTEGHSRVNSVTIARDLLFNM